MKKIYILLFCLTFSFGAYAQEDQQEEKVDVAALRAEYARLSASVDSLQTELDDSRANYDKNPQQYGAKIVTLESKLYEVRQRLSVVERKAALIPQFNENKNTAENQTNKSFTGRNINDSPFFRKNISQTDIKTFKSAPSIYKVMDAAKTNIDRLYDSLKSMKVRFDKTDSQDEVDAIIISSESVKKSLAAEDAKIASSWLPYYNSKCDNYLVLLDKLGDIPRSKLESLDLLSRQAQVSDDSNDTYAPALGEIRVQNNLLLAYEELLAERLGYKAALDSITAVKKLYENAVSPKYPELDFPYRTTCVYGKITTGNTYPYSTPSEIPQVKIPSKGVYYSVQLYMSQYEVKQLSTFKGAAPLMQFKNAGYNKYLAGGYRTYADANKDLAAMLKAGFKSPRVVAWVNGTLTTVDKAKLAEKEVSQGGYVIEVKSAKSTTATAIKDVLDVHAKGKSWTKSTAGDKTLYRVMTFSSREEAEVIAQIIKTKDSSVEIAVVENE